MGIFENIKIAIEGLRINKIRSLLTMLGIIMGIASVIAIVTIGDALTNSVSKGFESFGANSVNVGLTPKPGHDYEEITNRDLISKNAIETMENRYSENIKSIVYKGAGSDGKISKGRK